MCHYSVKFVVNCVHQISRVSRDRSRPMYILCSRFLLSFDEVVEFAAELEQLANFKYILGVLFLLLLFILFLTFLLLFDLKANKIAHH